MTTHPLQPAPPCDFGGTGPVVHLAHANGFPPGAYRPLANTLTDHPPTDSGQRYHVIGLPARPLWPGSRPESISDWHPLADDMIQGLDDLGLRGIIGVGHSMGGVFTLWATVSRPDLFRAVVLVDPVILPQGWLWMVRLSHLLRLERRLPMVQGALRRRRTWPSRHACYEQYRDRSVFATWPDDSLRAYVEAGTRERADGQVELAYPPEWEARIFSTAPTDVWQAVPKLRTPALVIRGALSETFRPESLARMERLLPQARFVTIPDASHLVPLERPSETGAAIRDFLGAATVTTRSY